MHKRITSESYKKFNASRAKNRLKRQLTHKRKQKAKRIKTQGLKKEQQRNKRIDDTFISLPAPQNFSFIENTEAVLSYIEKLKDQFKKKKNVLVNFKDVTNLTNDSLVLLISVVHNPHLTNGVFIRGNFPKDEKLRKILVESGLFKLNVDDGSVKNYLITRRNKKADGKIAEELIRRAVKVVFGQEGRCPGIYKALMESMANTCYHAKPQQTGQETWWLTVYHNKIENYVSFAFIDTGVGIFRSTKMRDFSSRFASFFGITDNMEILKEIVSGRKRSSTKIPYRGKGLPAIYKGLERNYYSNLKIISNDVIADLKINEFRKLEREFRGTFLYFELNNTNRWTQ